MEIFKISCAAWYWFDIENFQSLGRLVLKRYRKFFKVPLPRGSEAISKLSNSCGEWC